jgi:hypothetical protein
MAEEEGIPITQETIDAFVGKLESWSQDLPIEERALLQSLLVRAGMEDDSEEPEVEGHAMGLGGMGLNFTPQILRRGLGAADDGTVDSWPKGGSWIKLWGQTIPK